MDGGGDGLGTLLTVVATVIAAVGVIGLVAIAFVMWRYRLPPRALFAMGGALVYLLSPIDVLPEALLGPLGLLDDAGVTTAAVLFVYKLIRTRQRLRDAGVLGEGGVLGRPPRTLRRPGPRV